MSVLYPHLRLSLHLYDIWRYMWVKGQLKARLAGVTFGLLWLNYLAHHLHMLMSNYVCVCVCGAYMLA